MEKFLVIANLKLNLFLIVIVYYTTGESPPPIMQKLEKLNLRCDINNSKYWDIIDWYFQRTPYIVATFITEGHRERQEFSTVFLKQLTKCE